MWIVDIENISHLISENCLCKECHSSMILDEITSERAWLGTKLSLVCSNVNCITFKRSPILCKSTTKQRQTYDINRKSVLASRLIGKARSGLAKVCSVIGLATPISKPAFSETQSFWNM